MKLLVQMEDPVFRLADTGQVYSDAVSARFFQFLKPYFDQISICAPARTVSRHESGKGLSWDNLPVQLAPMPYWGRMERFCLNSPGLWLKVAQTARAAIAAHDVIWLRLPSVSAGLFYMLARLYRRPLMLHVGGNILRAWQGEQGISGRAAALRKAASRFLHWQTKAMASRSITLLTGLELTKIYGQNSNKSALFVDSQFSQSDIARNDDTCAGPTVNVLFAGQLRRAKGVFELIDAVEQVNAEGSPKQAIVHIAGYGPLSAELECLQASGESPHFRFEGYVGFGNGLEDLFRSSDIFVMPSTTYPEGFPRAILDAWAAGLPVVATAIGGIPGIVVDGHNGLLCPPGSTTALKAAIQRLIADSELRQHIIANGRSAAFEFSGEMQARGALEKLIGVYPKLRPGWPQLDAIL